MQESRRMRKHGHCKRKAEGQQQLGFPLHQGEMFGVAVCWCLVLDGQHPLRAVLVADMSPALGLSLGPFMGSHAPWKWEGRRPAVILLPAGLKPP